MALFSKPFVLFDQIRSQLKIVRIKIFFGSARLPTNHARAIDFYFYFPIDVISPYKYLNMNAVSDPLINGL